MGPGFAIIAILRLQPGRVAAGGSDDPLPGCGRPRVGYVVSTQSTTPLACKPGHSKAHYRIMMFVTRLGSTQKRKGVSFFRKGAICRLRELEPTFLPARRPLRARNQVPQEAKDIDHRCPARSEDAASNDAIIISPRLPWCGCGFVCLMACRSILICHCVHICHTWRPAFSFR